MLRAALGGGYGKYAEFDGVSTFSHELIGDGDFRSDECIEILNQSDVVVTNPPFSLFRPFISQLMEHGKKFLVIGNMNAIMYKEIFPFIKDGRIWIGCTKPKEFITPDLSIKRFGNILWFTNLNCEKHHEPLELTQSYYSNPEKYPRYDNYDAIESSKVKDIPYDYDGIIGVPITFLDKHDPSQFEIVGGAGYSKDYDGTSWSPKVNGKNLFKRILIQRIVELNGEHYETAKDRLSSI